MVHDILHVLRFGQVGAAATASASASAGSAPTDRTAEAVPADTAERPPAGGADSVRRFGLLDWRPPHIAQHAVTHYLPHGRSLCIPLDHAAAPVHVPRFALAPRAGASVSPPSRALRTWAKAVDATVPFDSYAEEYVTDSPKQAAPTAQRWLGCTVAPHRRRERTKPRLGCVHGMALGRTALGRTALGRTALGGSAVCTARRWAARRWAGAGPHGTGQHGTGRLAGALVSF